ncbi:hypothetical protein [Streptomyces sp. NPDC052036]|uniref:hypothetical protein n=1 Tax=Streptomyces sp. NPDC052036 TaxID=3155171 RepID=UPI003444B389
MADDPEHGIIQLRMEDGGEADVYYSRAESKLTSVSFTHFATGALLDLVAQLATSLQAVVIPQEGGREPLSRLLSAGSTTGSRRR